MKISLFAWLFQTLSLLYVCSSFSTQSHGLQNVRSSPTAVQKRIFLQLHTSADPLAENSKKTYPGSKKEENESTSSPPDVQDLDEGFRDGRALTLEEQAAADLDALPWTEVQDYVLQDNYGRYCVGSGRYVLWARMAAELPELVGRRPEALRA
eukprot:CAMPEP_0194690368 /NCGR_PEP_ID=MMETSP0295-20121207/18273_1 /TAXON_ID=39354 /ORGANISM="Heterosigma akashiwo, Strain CCMP2393" /LENGTH=152 /DNA_ID=CAMNT_0039579803 /DNA_START=117 /DNA_END=572 /DNA_ORIENTATION=+